MATLAELHERREGLREAISTGALELVFRDRRIRYQQTSDMLKALRELDAEIARAEGRPRIRFHDIHKARGW